MQRLHISRRWVAGALTLTTIASSTIASSTIASSFLALTTDGSAVSAAEYYPPGAGMRGYHIYDLSGGAPGVSGMQATGISDSGTVVGTSVRGAQIIDPFVWAPALGQQMLDKGGEDGAAPMAISPDGETIVGWAESLEATDGYHVRWQWDEELEYFGAMERIGTYVPPRSPRRAAPSPSTTSARSCSVNRRRPSSTSAEASHPCLHRRTISAQVSAPTT